MKGDKPSLMSLPLVHVQIFAGALGVRYTQYATKELIVDSILLYIRESKNKINQLEQKVSKKPVNFKKELDYEYV